MSKKIISLVTQIEDKIKIGFHLLIISSFFIFLEQVRKVNPIFFNKICDSVAFNWTQNLETFITRGLYVCAVNQTSIYSCLNTRIVGTMHIPATMTTIDALVIKLVLPLSLRPSLEVLWFHTRARQKRQYHIFGLVRVSLRLNKQANGVFIFFTYDLVQQLFRHLRYSSPRSPYWLAQVGRNF